MNISQRAILEVIGDEIHKYQFPPKLLNGLQELFQKYMKEIFKESKKNHDTIVKKIEEVREKKSRLIDVKLSNILSDDDFLKKSKELEIQGENLKEQLNDINYAETKISEESVELLELLSNLPTVYKNSDVCTKRSIANLVFSELEVVNKKELKLEANTMFKLIYEVNNPYWWS